MNDLRAARIRLGDRIRQYRELAGMSQKDLEEATGISRVHISGLERGTSSPSVEKILLIARAVHCRASDLLEEQVTSGEKYTPDSGYDLYPGLRELMNDEKLQLLYKITDAEMELLKSVRFQRQDFQPSKEFFVEVLWDLRRRRDGSNA